MSRYRIPGMVAFGLLFGFTLGQAGFSDYDEIHRMWTLGLLSGGPSLSSLRLMLAFMTAVAVAMVGFFLFARHDQIPPRHVHRGSVPGGVLFGVGWALSGGCPAVTLVQLGEGQYFAVWTIAGILCGAWCGRRVKARFRISAGSCMGE